MRSRSPQLRKYLKVVKVLEREVIVAIVTYGLNTGWATGKSSEDARILGSASV